MALLGRWKLTEGTGTTAADSSGNGRTATLRNTTTWANSSRYGGGPALSLPQVDNSIASVENDATIAALTAVSFGGWCRYSGSGANNYALMSKQDGVLGNTDDEFTVFYNGPTPQWVVLVKTTDGGIFTTLSTGVSMPSNVWTHIFVTYSNPGGLKFYMDGNLRGSVASQSANLVLSATTKIIIGGNANATIDRGANTAQETWNGLISDVQLHDVALTATDVRYAMSESDSFRPTTFGGWR